MECENRRGYGFRSGCACVKRINSKRRKSIPGRPQEYNLGVLFMASLNLSLNASSIMFLPRMWSSPPAFGPDPEHDDWARLLGPSSDTAPHLEPAAPAPPPVRSWLQSMLKSTTKNWADRFSPSSPEHPSSERVPPVLRRNEIPSWSSPSMSI